MALSAQGQTALNNFLANATERSVSLPKRVTFGNGGDVVPLPHAGVPTMLVVNFAGSTTVKNGTTVGTVTASPFWPYNLMAPSTLQDYQGNTRVYADGYQLYQRDLVIGTARSPKGPFDTEAYSGEVYSAAIPSGVAGGSVTSPLNFSVAVPISLGSNTVLGSYPGAVPDGTANFILKENLPITGSHIDSPLTTSGNAEVSISGKWSFNYVYLDAPKSVAIPIEALSYIHLFYQQNADSDQLVAGGTPQQILQTGETYYRIFLNLIINNQNIMSTSAPPIDSLKFLVNSSTPTVDWDFQTYLYLTRRYFNRDFPMLLYNFFDKPWAPNNYGSLTTQQKLTDNVTTGSYQQVVYTRETLLLPSGNQVAIGG